MDEGSKLRGEKVLYIHGLEGNSNSKKVKLLEKRFENVKCMDMHFAAQIKARTRSLILSMIPFLVVLVCVFSCVNC